MEHFKTLVTWKRCKSMFFRLFSGRLSALEQGAERSAAGWSVATLAAKCVCLRACSRSYAPLQRTSSL